MEHTHRLIATAVGLCTLGLCIGTLQRRLWLLLCGVFAPVLLGGAIAFARLQQRDGSLPALPALLVLVGFAGCAWAFLRARGPGRLAVLALALVMAQGLSGARAQVAPTPLLWATAGLTFLQIVLGAAIRHTGAGLVCTDLPYCRGAWWPTGVHPSVHLHMLHRALAFAVLALVVWNAVRLSRGTGGAVRLLAWAGPAIAVAQMALGVLTILTFKDLLPVTGHLLFAALLLADLVSLLALTRPAEGPEPARQPVGAPA